MSDILADIDDTLADWDGSVDSMRWWPNGGDTDGPSSAYLDRLRQQILDAYDIPDPLRQAWGLVPEVWPQSDRILDLNHQVYLQPGMVVQIDGEELLRVVEGAAFGPWRVRPLTGRRSKLDARYHQRQKNRRKRRR